MGRWSSSKVGFELGFESSKYERSGRSSSRGPEQAPNLQFEFELDVQKSGKMEI